MLKKMVASRKLPTGKVKKAKIALLSNQGHTARGIATKLDCKERTALGGSTASTSTAWPASKRDPAKRTRECTARRTSVQ